MIDWKQAIKVIIDFADNSVTIETAQGYSLARSEYETRSAAMESANKATKMMINSKVKR